MQSCMLSCAGVAGVVVSTLEELGRPLDGVTATTLRAKLAAKEKGEEVDQCVGALCVAILYLGRAFKEAENQRITRLNSLPWEALR